MRAATKKINVKLILICIIAICIITLVWYMTLKPLILKKTPEFEVFNKMFKNDNQIALNQDNYSIVHKEGTNKDNKTNLKFEFSGTDTIWEINTTKETKVKIKINSKIENGKFKVCLISPTNEVTTLCNKSSKKEKDVTLKAGKSRIKLVGLSAKGTLKLDIISNNNKDILSIVPLHKGVEITK